MKSKTIPFTAVAIFIFLLLLHLSSVGNRPFYTRGEAREALVVQSMEKTGDLILPRRNTELPSKPPMFHWLAVGSAKIWGESNEATIRFPSALCGAFAVSIFFTAAAISLGWHTALLATFFCATSVLWSMNSSHARVDMCFAFGMTAVFVSAARIIEDRSQNIRSNIFLFIALGFFTAFSILSKGPAALLIISAFILIGSLALIGMRESLKLVLPCSIALGAGTLCAGIWYVFALLDGGESFAQKQFVAENVGRFFGTSEVGHIGSVPIAVRDVLLSFLPWTAILPLFLAQLFEERHQLKRLPPFVKLCGVWFLLFLYVISLSRSKRDVYFLPSFPQLSLLLAWTLHTISRKEFNATYAYRISASLCLAIGMIFLAGGLASIFGGQLPAILPENSSRPLITTVFLFLAENKIIIAALCCAAMSWFYLGWKMKQGELFRGGAAVLCSQLLLIFTALHVVSPAVAEYSSPREFMADVVQKTKGEPIYQYRHELYTLPYYAKREIPIVNSTKEINDHQDVFVLICAKELPELLASKNDAEVLLESSTLAANARDKLYLVRLQAKDIGPTHS